MQDVKFADENTGYILSLSHIYRTVDGGSTWQQLASIKGGDYLKLAGDFVAIKADSNIYGNGGVYYSTNAGNSWDIIFPAAEIETVEDISVVQGGTCFLLTSEGIRKTINAGSNWSFFPSDLNFTAIHFSNDNVGFAGDMDGAVYKTFNGGETWLLIMEAPPLGGYVHEFDFPSQSVGYHLSRNGKIMRSTDAGTTWSPTDNDPSFVNSIDFITEDIGIAAADGPAIYRTDNGGDTWEQISLGQGWDIQAAAFLNSEVCFAVSTAIQVYKSYDQGLLWDELTCPTGAVVAMDISNNDEIFVQGVFHTISINTVENSCQDRGSLNFGSFAPNDIEMINTLFGFALTDNGHVSRTEDGGLSWFNFEYGNNCETGVDFSYANGKLYLSSQCENGFYISEDMGLNWTMSTGVAGAGKIHVHNENTIYIYPYGLGSVEGDVLYKSTDGGINWESIQLPAVPLRSAHFPTESTGYASCGESLYKTTDGGNTWNLLDNPLDGSGNFRDMRFINESFGWFLRSGNELLETQDGGITWTAYPADGPFYNILASNENTLYVGCVADFVLKKELSEVVSTSNTLAEENILLYPNPIDQNFTLVLPGGHQAASARLYSLDGRLAGSINIDQNCSTCALHIPANLASGLYLIEIACTGGERFIQRAVVQ